MPSDTSAVIGWFYRESFDKGTLDFDDLLYRAVRSALSKSAMDTEAYLVRNCTRLWNELLKALDNDVRWGRSVIFNIEDVGRRKLSWLPSNLGVPAEVKEKRYRARLGSRPALLRLLDELSDREYEALGCVICELIGATDVLVTPQGNERGVDFLATINLTSRCHVFNGHHKLFRIVGQAKKYGRKVEFKEVQRITDTLQEIRYQTPAMQKILPTWFQVASGPIVGWLNAHNGVQSGGVTYAKTHGIIIADSTDLAEILSISRRLESAIAPAKRVAVLRSRIQGHLQ